MGNLNAKVIGGGIVVIVVILILIYALSRGGGSTTADLQADQQASNTSTSTQVQGQDITVGTGTEATAGSIVSVLYVGELADKTVFDSSAAHDNQAYSFLLGSTTAPNSPIPGFQIGVNGMKVGGERLIAIPPTLGYGDNAIHQNPQDPSSPVLIPANSTLYFDVKLVGVQDGSSAQ